MESIKKDTASKNLFLLAFCAFWDRFSFYGIFTLIVLYLTSQANYSDNRAYDFWGVYVVLGSMLPVVGGFIGDRLLSYRKCILYGNFGIFLGSVLLLIPIHQTFILGVSIFLLGVGVLKANLATVVGLTNPGSTAEKDQTYTKYFMGMVIGATLGPVVFGEFVAKGFWHLGFMVSAIGCGLSFVFLKVSSVAEGVSIPDKINLPKFPLSIFYSVSLGLFFVSVLIVMGLFNFPRLSQYAIFIVLSLIVVHLCVTAFKGSASDTKRIIFLILISFFAIFYFAGSIQVDGSLNLFIKRFVHHEVFGWTIPVMDFSSIEPLVAAVFAPIFAWGWFYLEKEKSIVFEANHKLLGGVLISAVSYFIFAIPASVHLNLSASWTLSLIIIGNAFLAFGGLLIVPTIMSSVNQLAPQKLKGTMMGLWFMSGAFAGLLGAFMARISDGKDLVHATENGFFKSYLSIAILLFVVGGVLVLLSPLFKWLLKGKRHDV